MMCAYTATMWSFVLLSLFMYQRKGARFRITISLLAYALMIGSFARVVFLVTGTGHATEIEVAAVTGLVYLTYRARGNVACLITCRSGAQCE